ncbi:MAG: 1-acyl-sn-glycerol-3-phosphate acyltransferase [Lachnospiraceae bacterium]|nr:1-acyl-sn-glycerol-3-phosphate acyltransferase [Lachnospiraceae bacterium]
MRSILIVIFLLLYFILTLPLFLILKLIEVFAPKAGAKASQFVVKYAFKMVLVIAGAKTTVLGLENIPTDRPVLFTSNHRSYVDVVLGYSTVPVLTGFVAKKEIAKFPGLNWWMTAVNCLFIDRDDMKQSLKVILAAIEKVKAGCSMFIMPEGTRNHSDELLPFKEGSFKIADKSGCPVVPVAISNADDIYELHKPWVRSAPVVIHYGKPIFLEEMSREERKTLAPRVMKDISDMLEEDKKYIKKTPVK